MRQISFAVCRPWTLQRKLTSLFTPSWTDGYLQDRRLLDARGASAILTAVNSVWYKQIPRHQRIFTAARRPHAVQSAVYAAAIIPLDSTTAEAS